MNIAREVDELFEDQLRNWELARLNYDSLQKTEVRSLLFEGFEIFLQFNPKRIISSAARVDPLSVGSRPCFLCKKNRPREQRGIIYHDDFVILVNPYPVFPGHLTIATFSHEPQRILSKLAVMLELAGNLPRYTVVYNGPQCGASAPDHFHFQAVRKGNLPVENDFSSGRACTLYGEIHGIRIYTWKNYLRGLITFSGNNIPELVSLFNAVYELLERPAPSNEEPMMNILAGFDSDRFILHLFPRKLHRPARYFATGDGQLLISPASIDLGGVMILPRKRDFDRILREDLMEVFREVCADEGLMKYLVEHLTGS
jgi:hypothetical protein